MLYADDATIVIKQNQCFKEVIKEISDYEQASGAKVNLRKTKGLWLGKWKHRTDEPLGFSLGRMTVLGHQRYTLVMTIQGKKLLRK